MSNLILFALTFLVGILFGIVFTNFLSWFSANQAQQFEDAVIERLREEGLL